MDLRYHCFSPRVSKNLHSFRCVKIIFNVLFATTICISTAHAQTDAKFQYRLIYSNDVLHRLKKENPGMVEDLKSIERFNNDFSFSGILSPISPIPVVFHILYKDSSEYVSQAQVFSQLESLSRDFGQVQDIQNLLSTYTSEKFDARAVSPELRFCLPQFDPEGNQTTGITYHSANLGEWSTDDHIKNPNFGGVKPWDTKRYLNVWVANLADSIAGYAQMPGGPATSDGIVIDYQMFGSKGTAKLPYTQGKTLTHLVGNYLGLFSLWGEYPCWDDYVWDTPIHNAPNFEITNDFHISTCDGYPAEMPMNFMDCTPDSIRFMFTYGQKIRMQASLSLGGNRFQLLNTATQCGTNGLDYSDRNEENQPVIEKVVDIKVFPNPADQQIRITANDGTSRNDVNYMVFNDVGVLKTSGRMQGGTETLNTKNWPDGLYVLCFYQTGKLISNHRISIAH